MHSFRNHPLAAALSFAIFSGAVSAQTTPDAGSLRQQIEQQRTLPTPAARPQGAPLPPAIKPTAGATITVKSFSLVGNTLLSSEQLTPALAPFVGQTLDFVGLQRAADTVTAAYREAGWMARVSLPQQDISEGRVSLQIVEARYGGYRFEGSPSQRVQREQIEAFFSARLKQGQPLNAAALDRGLLLADDLPGVSVAGTLVAGQNQGETALVLQTTDEPFIYGDVGLDNTGARATGSHRVTANMNINSPGGRGELVSLNLLHTEGSDYGRVAMTVPVGYDGMRVGVSASSMNYRVIEGLSNNTDAPIKGRSSSMGVDWNYPLVRARISNVYLSGGLERKGFYTQDTQVRSDYESGSLRLGLSGNRFDDLGGGGANSASVQMLWGRLLAMQAHSQIDGIDRSYHKLNYSLSRLQTLTTDHSLLLSLQGQRATQVLDSSEKFYIGGASSVRAYPVSELGGERGQMLTAEWRWRLTSAWVLSAFADHGRAVSLPLTSSEQGAALNLSGHGLSASWQAPMGISTKLTWSRRNGSHPQPYGTDTKTDRDGTLKLNRLWFTASLPF